MLVHTARFVVMLATLHLLSSVRRVANCGTGR